MDGACTGPVLFGRVCGPLHVPIVCRGLHDKDPIPLSAEADCIRVLMYSVSWQASGFQLDEASYDRLYCMLWLSCALAEYRG